MAAHLAEKIRKALNGLDAAIDTAALAVSASPERDEVLERRMESYREVVRRQRLLAYDLSCALRRADMREVSRLANLLQASSAMIKADLSQIAENLSGRRSERAAA